MTTTSRAPLHTVAPPEPVPAAPAASPLMRLFRRISGPETTPDEIVVQLAGMAVITAAAVLVASRRRPGWSALQWALAAAIAFDFAGGVVANATLAAKRWFHRAGRGRARAMFYVGHAHPLVLPLLFGAAWAPAVALYAGMLVAVALVERAPRRVAQPVALGAVAAAIVLAGAGAWPPGLEWFAPLYLLKLVGAHAVPPQP